MTKDESVEEPRRKVGRPTKFDKEVASRIIDAMKRGAWKKTAALWAGIDYGTLRRWLRKGKLDPDSDLGRFRQQLLEAETLCEIKAGQVALAGAMKDPKIAIDWLRVRHRSRWRTQDKVQLAGDPKHPLMVERRGPDLSKLTDAELALLESIASKVTGGGDGQE